LPELVHDGSLQNMSRAGFYPDLRQVGSAFPAPKIQGGVIFRFLSGHAAWCGEYCTRSRRGLGSMLLLPGLAALGC